jgi:hypothetical protein
MTEKLTVKKLERVMKELWDSIDDSNPSKDPRDYFMTPEEGRRLRELLTSPPPREKEDE